MTYSYYGRLDGELKGDNLPMTLIQDSFNKLIKRNQEKINKVNKDELDELKANFKQEMMADFATLRSEIKAMKLKISNLEGLKKDEKK